MIKKLLVLVFLISSFMLFCDDNPNDYLFDSINYDNIENVKVLLKEGADPNLKNEFGVPALTRVCEYNTGYEIAKILISFGANVNAKDDYGITALMMASYYGYKDIAELLLSKGAVVNFKTTKVYDVGGIKFPKNATALSIAILKDQADIVKILKKYGAK